MVGSGKTIATEGFLGKEKKKGPLEEFKRLGKRYTEKHIEMQHQKHDMIVE